MNSLRPRTSACSAVRFTGCCMIMLTLICCVWLSVNDEMFSGNSAIIDEPFIPHKPRALPLHEEATSLIEDKIRWVFTTDCTAYQFTQGNMLLASAVTTGTVGAWTWIIYGCAPLIENDQNEQQRTKALKQRELFTRLAHPNCSVFFMPATALEHPDTGKEMQHFQASNRPLSLLAWWKEHKANFTEKAIILMDPDMFFLRPVVFERRASTVPLVTDRMAPGAWKVPMVSRTVGGGGQWRIGCPIRSYKEHIDQLCGDRKERCYKVAKMSISECEAQYGSGPPWVMATTSLDEVLEDLLPTSMRMHVATSNHMLSEQFSFGIAQMLNGMTNRLDFFWYMSYYYEVPYEITDWDACAERTILPPSKFPDTPPLLHTCHTYDIAGTTGFRLHKDFIHKDILDCSAPLRHYPPRDSLEKIHNPEDKKSAWIVCLYTNTVNHYVTQYKKQFCRADQMNLRPDFAYPPYGKQFLNRSSEIAQAFRPGGWTDKSIDFLTASK